MSGSDSNARRFPLALHRHAASALLRPQRHVATAHADATRQAQPSGLGLDSARVRERMIERLRGIGIADERVLRALACVPRHHFVDAALATQAYEDTSLPIGHGQTISKPSIVARMLELLLGAERARDVGLGAVLEIGTGCGYQAALLAELGRRVVSVERVQALHEKAKALLAPLRDSRLRLVWGDGKLGHPPGAPYDGIVAAASGEDVPQAWLDQLEVGGRLVAPVDDPQLRRRQVLVVIDRKPSGFERHVHEAVQFVPLKSGLAR